MQYYIESLITKTVLPGVQSIFFALVVLIVGMFAIKWVIKKLKLLMDKSRIDANLKPFTISLIDAILKVFVIVTVISILGIPTSSFLAVLASAGLAIGLAFQGSLSNIAGGVLLLTTKPISVGNFIETNGYSGTVQATKILYTEIVTPDNKVIFIPNGSWQIQIVTIKSKVREELT